MEEDKQSINEIVEKAFRLALNKEHEYVTLEHLTLVLLENRRRHCPSDGGHYQLFRKY
jgi:ATP-dependent Clp protease ATP-binding subunit ClpA